MSGEILINYEEVYSKARELRTRLSTELREMDAGYRQINSALIRMDGRTNAELMETCAINQAKSQATVDALQHLIMFIEQSARATEQEEQAIKRVFDQTAVQASRATNNRISAAGGAN